jgi:hypothetical protein
LSSIKDAINELSSKAILLTPHQFGPSNDAAEHDYLLNGWINAGFFIVNRENLSAKNILHWLIHRISRRGFVAPALGLFCDQAWMSLLPSMFANYVVVSTLAGCNVGYWNLGERHLECLDGRFKVNGEALAFFHFSGFIGANRGQLTKHGDFKVPSGSALEKLCEKYSSLLKEAHAIDVSKMQVLSCSKVSLKERIALGCKMNSLNIVAPTIRRGLFSRIGGKLDALFARHIT